MKSVHIILLMPLWAAIQWLIHSSSISSLEHSSRLSSSLVGSPSHHVNQVPRNLHYLWPNTNFSFGDDDPDNAEQKRTLQIVETIRSNNPDWQVKIWTDDDCYALMKQHFPDFYETWTNLTPRLKMWDAVRPAILWVHGGIYLDHDIECDQGVSFSNWLRPQTTLLLREPTLESKKLGNHFMGSAPRHPLWKLYIKNIIEEIPENFSVGMHTGPRQFYPTFQEYGCNISEEERATIRLLGMNEMDTKGECEKAEEYEGFCAQPRCSHMHTISPAELAGEDDYNPEKQMLEFKDRLAHNYTKAKCSCRRFETFLSAVNATHPEDHPTVFIHIPKTGGTTIEYLLGFIDSSCHATATDMRNCNPIEFDKALTFTALRHPVERAISLYTYAFSGGNGRARDLAKYSWVKEVNFSAFVDAIPSQDDFMFAPQQHYIVDHNNQSSLLVDEFLCAENLKAGWERLASTTAPNLQRYGDFPITRLRVTPSNSSHFMADQVDAATLERLHEIYHDDFELWQEHCSELQVATA